MDITITQDIPKTKPISTYETSFIYLGLRRYDSTKKKLQTITKSGDKYRFEEIDYIPTVISRGYHTELVRVTEYSIKPRIWMEEINDHAYVYRQIQ